jgi:hypothetical protein
MVIGSQTRINLLLQSWILQNYTYTHRRHERASSLGFRTLEKTDFVGLERCVNCGADGKREGLLFSQVGSALQAHHLLYFARRVR